MIVVSDTSAITNLAAINQLRLLPLLYQRVIIPEAVYRELVNIEPPVPGSAEATSDFRVSSALYDQILSIVNET
ncbi:MAG: hypothetical protein SFW36_16215 [Leptolyngbyaceae cyanobacterium bins.59]|nr:hypothetical protein [Leptolyngbyaceae cyanobacterium bins.59]